MSCNRTTERTKQIRRQNTNQGLPKSYRHLLVSVVWLLSHFFAVAEHDAAEVEGERRKLFQGFVDMGRMFVQAVDVEQAKLATASRVVKLVCLPCQTSCRQPFASLTFRFCSLVLVMNLSQHLQSRVSIKSQVESVRQRTVGGVSTETTETLPRRGKLQADLQINVLTTSGRLVEGHTVEAVSVNASCGDIKGANPSDTLCSRVQQ